MRCIVSPTDDPYFNLAAEEFFFSNFADDILFLYSNSPAVVVGKHQNAIAEINPLFVYNHSIKVVRRISGGGAVFHDKGNLNFSFHRTVSDISGINYSDFSFPVVNVLNALGIPAVINERNDIVVDGYKVSGHAQHVFRNRVLSHGTLLINSDLDLLSGALKKGVGTFESKAIPSIRSKVVNISDYCSIEQSVEKVRDHLIEYILNEFPRSTTVGISEKENELITELANRKYASQEWNYGYSPSYRFLNEMILSEGKRIGCDLSIEKGVIVSANLYGDYITAEELKHIENSLIGTGHIVESLYLLIYKDGFLGKFTNELIHLLF